MIHHKALVLALFGLLVLGAGCGDDDEDGGDGTSGAGGTGSRAGSGAIAGRTGGGGNTTGVGSGGSGGSANGSASGGSGGRGFNGGGGRMGGGMQVCPAAEPASGETCQPGRGDCSFGPRVCDCLREGSTWACWDPADCPTTAPANDSACSTVGMQCEYGGGDDCDCESTGWDCGGDFGGNAGQNGGDEDAGI